MLQRWWQFSKPFLKMDVLAKMGNSDAFTQTYREKPLLAGDFIFSRQQVAHSAVTEKWCLMKTLPQQALWYPRVSTPILLKPSDLGCLILEVQTTLPMAVSQSMYFLPGAVQLLTMYYLLCERASLSPLSPLKFPTMKLSSFFFFFNGREPAPWGQSQLPIRVCCCMLHCVSQRTIWRSE